MKKIICFLLSLIVANIYAQESITFRNGLPENSHFKIKSTSENSGTMKISGTPSEMETLKKAGYNLNRKINSNTEIIVDLKTQAKLNDSVSFEFFYDKIDISLNSDGKTSHQSLTFPDRIIQGTLKNDKVFINSAKNSGNEKLDQYLNSLQKNIFTEITTVNNLKIGESFTIKKDIQLASANFKTTAIFTYEFRRIENDLGYFDVKISLINAPKSSMEVKGDGAGEMIYDIKGQFIKSQKAKILTHASQIDKDLKIISDIEMIINYELTQ